MPCRRSSSLSASVSVGGGGAASLISLPFEVPAVPGPDESLGQEEDEHEHREQRTRGQGGEGHREGQEKQKFDVEDQEQDGVQVIVGFELDPRVARRREAALVDGVLHVARLRRLDEAKPQPRDPQQRDRKGHRGRRENGEKRIGVGAHWMDTSITAARRLGSMLIGRNCPSFAEMAAPGTTFEGDWQEKDFLLKPEVRRTLRWPDGFNRAKIFEAVNVYAGGLLSLQRQYASWAGMGLLDQSLDELEKRLAQARENGACLFCLGWGGGLTRSEEHTSELQSLRHLV